MNEEIKNMVNTMSSLSDSERVDLAQHSLEKLFDGLTKNGMTEKSEKISFMFTLIKLFISADRDCGVEEYSFFLAVTELTEQDCSYDQFYLLTDGGINPQFKEDTFNLLKSMDEDTRSAAIIFGLSFLNCDDKIDLQEIKLLKEVLSL